MIYKGF